jgi:hypothetical protein
MAKWYVSVEGWLTRRKLSWDNSTIRFEVAGSCSAHCRTCKRRMDHVVTGLDQARQRGWDGWRDWHWTSGDTRESCILVLEGCHWKREEVLAKLSELLNIRLT